MVKQAARLDGEEMSGGRLVEVTQEEAVAIQKAALVMLMQAPPETRLAHASLPERYTVDHIRAVYQNLPEFDEASLRARDVITRAARLLSCQVSADGAEQKARTVIDAWRDEWHLEPEPEMDGANSEVYESLVSHVANALRAATPPPAVTEACGYCASPEHFSAIIELPDHEGRWHRSTGGGYYRCTAQSAPPSTSSAAAAEQERQYAPRYPWHPTENDHAPMVCKHCGAPVRQVVTTWIHAGDNVFCRPRQLKQAEPLFAKEIEMELPNIEIVSAKVHEAWMEGKKAQGVSSRLSEKGEELMVPYDQLSNEAQELDRGTVRAVYAAIEAAQGRGR